MNTFSFTGNGGASPGYDLDFVCTGETPAGGVPGPSSCKLPEGGMLQVDTSAANGAGIDAVLSNNSGALYQIFHGSLDTTANTQENIQEGDQTIMLVIDDYNGLANDPQISVTAYTGHWLQATDCRAPDPATGPVAGDHPTPKGDGCDVWSTVAATPGASFPQFFTTNDGYVNNYQLVADFLVGIPIEITGVSFVPQSPHIVANLQFVSPEAGAPTLNPDAGAGPF